jgi:hypothetical protein
MTTEAQGALAIAFSIASVKLLVAFLLWFFIKPKNLNPIFPKDIARKWLAYMCLVSPFAIGHDSDINPTFIKTVAAIVIFGLLAYISGYIYGYMLRRNGSSAEEDFQSDKSYTVDKSIFENGGVGADSIYQDAIGKNIGIHLEIGSIPKDQNDTLRTASFGRYLWVLFVLAGLVIYVLLNYKSPLQSIDQHVDTTSIAKPDLSSDGLQIFDVDFEWSPHNDFKFVDKVVFANGDLIEVAEGASPGVKLDYACEIKRVEVREKKTNQLKFVSPACDGIVFIQAAYPSLENAKLAIVTTNCGGTMCSSWSDHFVFYLGQDNSMRVANLGSSYYSPKDKPTTYKFGFEGPRLNKAVVENFFDGDENSLGDKLSSTRVFHEEAGFVDLKFRKEFYKFIGDHPDAVLGDANARSGLIKNITPEVYKSFRASMSGPGYSSVVRGRYLVMNACMKSNCPWEFGSVILDGFDGSMHIVRFSPDQNIFDYASSSKSLREDDSYWLDAIATPDGFRLYIESGALRLIKQ